MQNVGAVIVAGGSGSRFDPSGEGVPKQFLPFAGKPILAWSVEGFARHPDIDFVAVVLPEKWAMNPPEWLDDVDLIVQGGKTRTESVHNGIFALPDSVEVVLIHDGARPLVSRELIDRVLESAGSVATIPGVPVTDTLKAVDQQENVLGTVDRSTLRAVQTPQGFPLDRLRNYHRKAARDGYVFTDDAGLFERYGESVRVVRGEAINVKITAPTDLLIAERLAPLFRTFADTSSEDLDNTD